MILPKSIKLGPHKIKIIFGADTNRELNRLDRFGESDIEASTISVRTDVAPSVARETLIHEILHHVWSLTALPTLLTPDQEEIVIRSVAPWLASLERWPQIGQDS